MVLASPVFFLVKDLVKTEEATAAIFGVLVSVSRVAMITGNFAGGFLADRIGRAKPYLPLSRSSRTLTAYKMAKNKL